MKLTLRKWILMCSQPFLMSEMKGRYSKSCCTCCNLVCLKHALTDWWTDWVRIMTARHVPRRRRVNPSVDRQFSARGFNPEGAYWEEVLKNQPEKECVGESVRDICLKAMCEFFFSVQGWCWGFTTKIRCWLDFVALPHWSPAWSRPGSEEGFQSMHR